MRGALDMSTKTLMAAIVAATFSVGCATMGVGTTDRTTGTAGTTGTVEAPAQTGPQEVGDSRQGVVPVGQELDVRLQDSLSSRTAQPEDRFVATTLVDLVQDGRVLIPSGSTVRGVVSSVDPAGRVERTGRITLTFDRISVNGREHEIRAAATQVFESEGIAGETGRIGTGAGVGAVVGGILGGLRGALAGILIGGGGVIAATEGQDVNLPAGSIIRIRFDTPVDVR
jgi:hypothetical protein